MAKRHVISTCRVCGWYGQLTFEHVPPQCAFNSSPARTYTLDQWMLFERGEQARWENDQRGSGYFALCDTCNNERGGKWYVPEFKEWAYLGADIVNNIREHPQRADIEAVNLKVSRCYPVRFIKQVVLMLLAINTSGFATDNEPLRRFVVERGAVGLPDRYRLFLGILDEPVARHAGLYFPMHVDETGMTGFAATDILYPPFSYTLTVDEPAASERPGEITQLASLGFEEQSDVELRLPYNAPLLPSDVGSPDRANA
jgi:hypothetical protein